ncbi:uncharacterized protein V1518DRAFT_415817 [Limtongia smithiae]|uniref:uncharacterized protein n=1 Tax=Limtongia smithiae TaxID=1125753 RepID=UPI0034CDBB62
MASDMTATSSSASSSSAASLTRSVSKKLRRRFTLPRLTSLHSISPSTSALSSGPSAVFSSTSSPSPGSSAQSSTHSLALASPSSGVSSPNVVPFSSAFPFEQTTTAAPSPVSPTSAMFPRQHSGSLSDSSCTTSASTVSDLMPFYTSDGASLMAVSSVSSRSRNSSTASVYKYDSLDPLASLASPTVAQTSLFPDTTAIPTTASTSSNSVAAIVLQDQSFFEEPGSPSSSLTTITAVGGLTASTTSLDTPIDDINAAAAIADEVLAVEIQQADEMAREILEKVTIDDCGEQVTSPTELWSI